MRDPRAVEPPDVRGEGLRVEVRAVELLLVGAGIEPVGAALGAGEGGGRGEGQGGALVGLLAGFHACGVDVGPASGGLAVGEVLCAGV